jgi:GNAT superfamily N-acetyltransferase
MAFRTFDDLNPPHGPQALALYHQAFPQAGRKPDSIIAGMFSKRMCFLQTESTDGEVTAMAVTGVIPQGNVLLIDYLAVREERRGEGVGRQFVLDLAAWARDELKLRGIILEAEADPGSENEERILFWRRCGFVLTDYVHKYIWVPETYRAMYLPFDKAFRVSDSGESLFQYIEWFHKKAFTR